TEPPPAAREQIGYNIASVQAAQREAVEVPVFVSGTAQGDAPPRRRTVIPPPEPEQIDFPSLTAGAIQRRWRTPTEFPQCPAEASAGALAQYLSRLHPGAIFARTRYGESAVIEAAIGPEGVL